MHGCMAVAASLRLHVAGWLSVHLHVDVWTCGSGAVRLWGGESVIQANKGARGASSRLGQYGA